jgi:FixJ family two-component response regulator
MSGERHFVLVVEDDLAVREALKFALELEGMSVGVCANGAELLMHPDLSRAKCLVLNEKLPAMDGIEVMSRLTAGRLRIPTILITGRATAGLRQRARSAGVRHILEKPLLDSALVDSIQNILAHPQ